MDIMGGIWGQVGNWVHDWATSAWKQDKAGDMLDHSQNFARDQQASAQAFSERMFKTRYQNETADMLAAGLNPMLAYMKGGGNAPSGSPVGGPSPSVPAFNNTGNTLMQNMASAAQIKLIDAQADNIKADTDVKKGQLGIQTATVQLLNSQVLQTDAYAALNDAQRREVEQTIQNLGAEIVNIRKRGELIDQEALLTHAQRFLAQEQTSDVRVRRVLNMLDVPQAVNFANAQFSTYMREVAPYTSELGKLIHSGAEARSMFRRHSGRITINQPRR